MAMFVLVIYQINYQITRINGHVQKLSYLVQLPDPEGMSSARLRRLRLQKKVCHGLSFRSPLGFPPGHGAPPLETLEKAKPDALLGPCLRLMGEHGRCGSFPMWNNDELCVMLLLEQSSKKHGFCFWFSQISWCSIAHWWSIFFSMAICLCYKYKYTVYRLWDDPANFTQHHPASKKWLGSPKYVLTSSMGSTFCLPCCSHFCLVNTLCLR